jgi:hypothetical protein
VPLVLDVHDIRNHSACLKGLPEMSFFKELGRRHRELKHFLHTTDKFHVKPEVQ